MTSFRRLSGLPFLQHLESLPLVRSVRGGLVMIIPVLMIGAFALVGRTLPVPIYLTFIQSFGGGFLDQLLNMIYTATFGMLSVYMTIAISISYCREHTAGNALDFGYPLTALLTLFVLAGVFNTGFSITALGPKGMFTALSSSLLASFLYAKLRRFSAGARLFADGADVRFNTSLGHLLPMTVTVLLFAAGNETVIRLFRVATFHELFIDTANTLFDGGGVSFITGFFYVMLASLLWFFGIHGSDCLEGVAEKFFTPGITANMEAVAAGGEPSVILTKQFFDVFVLMGGCGTGTCLLVSLLLFSRRKSNRSLSKFAAFPMLFNISELMTFGLPVIWNFVLFIPFVLTPLVCYTTSYLALSSGLVPLVTTQVEWTTPILLGGFTATGSVAGSVLQLFNLMLGIAIYCPFVRLLDRQKALQASTTYRQLEDTFRAEEESGAPVHLTELDNVCGSLAKAMVLDLREALTRGRLRLFYQPQYAVSGECIGVEALLRWNHSDYGMIYPPLVMQLAREGALLEELEETILRRALDDAPAVHRRFGADIKLSVNVTGTTITQADYLHFVQQLAADGRLEGEHLCLEITEQTAVRFNEDSRAAFDEIRTLGITFAIDDFSMGQTSIDYLKDSVFSLVKLDGSLVSGILTNPRCREIIASIVALSHTLDVQVLAEYVETAEQRDALAAVGCTLYQGYLYSPAVDVKETA